MRLSTEQQQKPTATLIDLGLARAINQCDDDAVASAAASSGSGEGARMLRVRTPAFSSIGSPAFMAPECVADARCAVAAYASPGSAAGAGVGRCYLKVSATMPIDKGSSGPMGCATRRATPPGPADEDVYDCRFRHLAMEFASSVVLASWSPRRRRHSGWPKFKSKQRKR